MISMFGTYGWTKFDVPTRPDPNLFTGVGHGHLRGPDKAESNHKNKKKTARKMAKQSRRKNRR